MKITFPHMGDYHICFKAFFESLDCQVLVPPPITKRTIEHGVRHSPEFVCFPFKITLGCLIEGLQLGADTLIQSGREGACRYGYYRQVQEKVLRDLGHEFRFVRIDSIRSFKAINRRATYLQILKGIKCAWQKMKSIDKIANILRKVRAHEKEKGASTRIYQEFLGILDQAQSADKIKNLTKAYLDRLTRLERSPSPNPLRVGIVGELYIVMESYSNLDMERQLNQLGVEVVRPLCLGQILRETLPWSSVKATFNRVAMPYLQYESGAHANVSVAETIIFAREGLDGVVHLKPHGCMPEVTAMGALYRVSKDYNIPVLFFSFDEHTSSVGAKTRLEAFVELLKRRRKKQCISA